MRAARRTDSPPTCRMDLDLDRRRWLKTVASLALPVGCGSGCSLLQFGTFQSAETKKQFLPPLVKPKDAVSVEIMLADRAIGDPMIGRPLWSSLNEVSATAAASRTLLEQHGIQYGLSSSTPSFALQSLMSPGGKSATQRMQRINQSFASGGENLVCTWPEVPILQCKVPTEGGRSVVKTFKTAECYFRVRIEKVEEAWGRLEFFPEIHHGPMMARPVPSDQGGWLYQQSREIETLYDLKFAVELNLGEMAVIGLKESKDQSLGHCFFRGAIDGQLERVMVIRLADIYQVDPVRQIDPV
jgi:hypothetical protein